MAVASIVILAVIAVALVYHDLRRRNASPSLASQTTQVPAEEQARRHQLDAQATEELHQEGEKQVRAAQRVAEARRHQLDAQAAEELHQEGEKQLRAAQRVTDQANRREAEARQRHFEQIRPEVKRWHDEQYPAFLKLSLVGSRAAHELETSFQQGARGCALLRDSAEAMLARRVYKAPTQELTAHAEAFLRHLRRGAGRCETQRVEAERQQVVVLQSGDPDLALDFAAAEDEMKALNTELAAFGF
jgi:hypothetical protein